MSSLKHPAPRTCSRVCTVPKPDFYSFTELERTLYVAFDSVGLRTIRRFADRSKRWMMAYINGLTAEQREYAEKLYKSHRQAGRDVFV